MAESGRTTAGKKLDQLVKITVDDSFEKIVELDSKGTMLRFDPDPDRFKQLAPDEVKKLSRFGQYAYHVARDENADLKDALKAEEQDILEKIVVGQSMGRAKQRLAIQNKQPETVYRWIRPDERNEFLSKNRGFKVVDGGPERTLGNETGHGPHVIGTRGSEELILVKRPQSFERAERRAKKNKRQAMLREQDEQALAEIEARGIPGVAGDVLEKGTWRDRVEEQGE